MKLVLAFVLIFQAVLLARSEEEDLFLANLKHQFAGVPRDVKLFDFLQNENNLKGLLGLHNDMCQQLTYYNDMKLKAQKRGRRDAVDETSAAPTVTDDTVNGTTADTSLVSDTTPASSDSTTRSSDSTTVGFDSTTVSSTPKRSRRDATDSSASTTNTTASSNPADDKDQQQNLNEQQPPVDDQGDQQAAAGEQQEAEMQAAGAAYFKQLILNVLRYILNCLMTYINMFY